MDKIKQSVNWKCLAIEGTVIVVSILLAFSVDAWWDELQKRDVEIKQLARVSAELDTNAEIIQRKIEIIAIAVDATSKFLSWMGPAPDNVEPQVLTNTWTKLYSIGTFSMVKGASETFLEEGRIGTARNAKVRNVVAEWYSLGENLERQYDLLRTAHANIGEYLLDSIPMLHLDSTNPAMAAHPTSKFPFDRSEMLSDPKLESRFSIYLIRLEFVSSQAQELLDLQSKLLIMTEAAADLK